MGRIAMGSLRWACEWAGQWHSLCRTVGLINAVIVLLVQQGVEGLQIVCALRLLGEFEFHSRYPKGLFSRLT